MRPFLIYGDGSTRRDYTYVDDVIEGLRRAMDYTATACEIINLGNNQTVGLLGDGAGVGGSSWGEHAAGVFARPARGRALDLG